MAPCSSETMVASVQQSAPEHEQSLSKPETSNGPIDTHITTTEGSTTPFRRAVDFTMPPALHNKDVDDDDDDDDEANKKRRRLSRLVSQCEMARSGGASTSAPPPCPNPLMRDTRILRCHIAALRLETDLQPLRMILSRLMHNQTHNIKGIFNEPVDPVALNLPDYTTIIKRPIDLGTIKRRLYANVYPSRQDAADDIRRVFTNAMLYNPPQNIIHKCAAELLSYFDSCYNELGACVLTSPGADIVNKNGTDGKSNDCTTQQTDNSPVAVSEVCSHNNKNADQGSTLSPRTDVEVTDQLLPVTTPRPSTRTADAGTAVVALPLSSYDSSKPTRKGTARVEITDVPTIPRKRRLSCSSQTTQVHFCADCQGRLCTICKQGCLQHEPSLLVCCGPYCAGSRIRKGAVYFISPDGGLQFCERCHSSLPSSLSEGMINGTPRYKQDLLKRRNDEEIAERWISCRKCASGVHAICAMHNSFVHDPTTYLCPSCIVTDLDDTQLSSLPSSVTEHSLGGATAALLHDESYTFVTGEEQPIPVSELINGRFDRSIEADRLPECSISKFIQEKVRIIMATVAPNAEKTITIRVISDCDRHFDVPEVIRRYFRMEKGCDDGDDSEFIRPPASVEYRQKAIAMFQKLDGVDVCIFCMFVHEYSGHQDLIATGVPADKRVYIAYIDSLSHFRPREIRTEVFHEILVSYLATARIRGFEKANIWSCPPSRGNCFVFWNHPSSQRTPNADRLQAWYHTALASAVQRGVVTDVRSLYETDFEKQLAAISHDDAPLAIGSETSGRMVCPPLIDGDFWVEEAGRIHSANIARQLKVRIPTDVCVWNVESLNNVDLDRCPVLQVAKVIKDRVMTHPASVPFRRPVNAAAMNLKNYHSIIKRPMDLGTIYARCVLGEYERLRDVVDDVELMTSNAKTFNPPGHIVHIYATQIAQIFYSELNALVEIWGHGEDGTPEASSSWQCFEDMSMSLDVEIETHQPSTTPETMQASVVVEDDLSTDASKSLSSSVVVSLSETTSQTKSSNNKASFHGDSSLAVNPEEGTNETSSESVFSRPTKRRAGRPKVLKLAEKTLHISTGDPKAIEQKMIGEDLWLLDKKSHSSTFSSNSRKKKDGKRRRSSFSGDDESSGAFPLKSRRRQSWLCEELTQTVRRMRTSFFSCSLVPNKTGMNAAEKEQLTAYEEYASSFCPSNDEEVPPSLADARSAILELCQFRNLEFDTLRRAKYSTSMLLYHLHHFDAPGSTPTCDSCGTGVAGVRWHKVEKIEDQRQLKKIKKHSAPNSANSPSTIPCYAANGVVATFDEGAAPKRREELCTECCKKSTCTEAFIPIMISTTKPV